MRSTRTLTFAFVAILALDHYRNHLALTPGIDFYQYWAVPAARRVSAEPLGSPYADTDRYVDVLRTIAGRSKDARLKAVAEFRDVPDFASDPLLYVIGGWLPGEYTPALKVYQGLQFAAFALALFLLARRASLPGLEAATLGLLMVLYFMPVLSDLRVLNTNVLQLCALAAAVSLLPPRRREGSQGEGNLGRASLGLSMTVLVAFLKPLWVPLPALAALFLLRHRGWLLTLKAGAIGGAFGLALLAWPAASFGPRVWSEWYQAVFRADPGRLAYGIEEGNRSATEAPRGRRRAEPGRRFGRGSVCPAARRCSPSSWRLPRWNGEGGRGRRGGLGGWVLMPGDALASASSCCSAVCAVSWWH